MKYLLDTNACIAIIKGRPEAVRRRFRKEANSGSEIFISSIVVFELSYGLGKSSRRQESEALIEALLTGPVRILSFDEPDGRAAGLLRAHVELRGSPIGAYDLLIAGQALARGIKLITANSREFQKVAGLEWENWAAS